MSVTLKNQVTGETWNTNNSGWSFITNVLREHGWIPIGTIIETDEIFWSGTYYSNDGQVVIDANAMADNRIHRINPKWCGSHSETEWIQYFKDFAAFCRKGPFEIW